MAIDSSAKRRSVLNLGCPGGRRILPIPDDNNIDGQQRAHFVGLYAGIVLSGGGVVVTEGTSLSIFLDDSTPVPANAAYLRGEAFSQDGYRYVALWPADDRVSYLAGFAYRQDGALLIDPAGVTTHQLEGVSMTWRGECVAAITPYTYVDNTWTLTNVGVLCLSDID